MTKKQKLKRGWCSIDCYRINQSLVKNSGKYVVGHRPHNKVYEWIEKHCLICNSIFKGKPFSMYCSMDCLHESRKGKTFSKEVCKRISKGVSEAYVNGKMKNNQKKHKHGHINTKFGVLWYRSSYELKFIKMAESDNKIWSLVSEPFRIEMDNGKNYIPDFLVNEKELVEVKPQRMLLYNKYKMQQAKTFCRKNNYEFRIITENELCLPKV